MIDYAKVYYTCLLIRRFEERTEQEFLKGHLRGTSHACIGQEIIPVCVMTFIDKAHDYVTGTHRCHGQVLAYTQDAYRLACEMMGRADGFVYGMGGSQHIKTGKYITNGITGGMVGIAAGIGLSLKLRKSKGIAVAFLGDGGFAEGYVQETLNLCKALNIPVLLIMENNEYAMSTRSELFRAGSVRGRIESMGIRYIHSSSSNIEKLFADMESAFDYVRTKQEPCFVEVVTYRLCGHSKSDSMKYMPAAEIAEYRKKDPFIALRNMVSENQQKTIETQALGIVNTAFEKAHLCKEMVFNNFMTGIRHGK